jgi:hypothetical protein
MADDEQPGGNMTIMIELTGPNSVNLVGPIQDKLLCFGMLEMAKAAVEEHHRELKYKAEQEERAHGVTPASDADVAAVLRSQRSKIDLQ